MNVEHLRECVHLAETLSFTATSKAFYISQSVLSKHIASLESELGINIFLRTKNRVAITETGSVFIEDIKQVLKKYDQTIEHVRRAKAGLNSSLRVGFLYGAGISFMSDAIRNFTKIHPDVAIELESFELHAIFGALDDEKIDIAVCMLLGLGERFEEGGMYNWEPLFSDEIAVFLPKGHPLERREVITASDLKGLEVHLPSRDVIGNDSEVLYQCLSHAGDDCNIVRNSSDLLSWCVAMKSHDMVAISFRHEIELLKDSFVCRPFVDPSLDFVPRVGVVWLASKDSELKRGFCEVAKAAAGRRP